MGFLPLDFVASLNIGLRGVGYKHYYPENSDGKCRSHGNVTKMIC